MKIENFKVEQWMNHHDGIVQHSLAPSCAKPLGVRELLNLAGENVETFLNELGDMKLGYGDFYGSPRFLKAVCSLFKNCKPEMVIATHGTCGANHMAMMALIEPGDNVVAIVPNYQQHYSIPESIGAEVRLLHLKKANHYLPDLDELRSLVDESTKMITLSNPNNPTGAFIEAAMLKEIADIAKSVDAYVLCDEIYRGLDTGYMTSIVDLYDKGISTGSMSKVFSMAGTRMGWIVSQLPETYELCDARRDYDTISCGVIDDLLAAIALENKDKILERNRTIIQRNHQILTDWLDSQPKMHCYSEGHGTTLLLEYDYDIDSRTFCQRAFDEAELFLCPGDCFELEHCFRIGYGYDSEQLMNGLAAFSEFLQKLDGESA